MNGQSRTRYLIIISVVIFGAIFITYLLTNKPKNATSKIDTRPPREAIAAVETYVKARENSVGADQASSTAWLNSIRTIVSAALYRELQPNPSSSTSTTSNEYITAHSSGYIVDAQLSNCAWDLEIGRPTETSGTIFCDLNDTTLDQTSKQAVPTSSLPFGWTRSGSQNSTVVSVVKQNGKWLVSKDLSNEAE